MFVSLPPLSLLLSRQSKLRTLYKDEKHVPLDLRVKGTRAWRRKLSKEDSARKTLKQQKKDAHFATRKYALKA